MAALSAALRAIDNFFSMANGEENVSMLEEDYAVSAVGPSRSDRRNSLSQTLTSMMAGMGIPSVTPPGRASSEHSSTQRFGLLGNHFPV